ncbi:MAG: MFS transporter [Thermoleophilia bacterium]|nr:MFS transporter [Thermoleophilia bacterium]
MRRLLAVASAIVFVDSMLYSALTPLLPRYAEDFELSKAGAGALVGAYAAGALAGGLPGGVAAARFGPRAAAVAGLVLVGAASVAFGLAGSSWMLGGARFAQGVGSALSWAGALSWLVAAAPRGRRGELLGSALGVAIVGAMLGPVLGAIAEVAGDAPTFAAVAGLAGALALIALQMPGASSERASLRTLGAALRGRRLLGGLWLVALPSLLFGLLAVLVPLELAALGWGAVAIGAIWLAAAGIEAAMNPLLGRFVDRRGRLVPVRAALVASVGVSIALAWAGSAAAVAALVLAAALAYGAMFTPGMSIISDGAERAGVAQAIAFGAMNAAWAVGNLVGPAAGGATADAFGDGTAYVAAAALCAATFVAVSRYRRLVPHAPRAPGSRAEPA